jgi:branched-chain amino acid transport system ATP-binding protein
MVLLEVNNVTKRFGGIVALNDVSLTLNEGEILGLIGPNGSGKTTLLNVISGFYLPDAGSIKFEGADISRSRPSSICRKGIARTFQIVKPFSGMTVLENVTVGALLRSKSIKEAHRKTEEILQFLGLIHIMKKTASDLTLADLRRLELARALATDPKLLLLDEVVAGLNPKEVDDMILLIKRIIKDGITLIIVEHVMRLIMSLCNRIVVLHQGEKIAEGEPREIANNPRVIKVYLGEKYVQRF